MPSTKRRTRRRCALHILDTFRWGHSASFSFLLLIIPCHHTVFFFVNLVDIFLGLLFGSKRWVAFFYRVALVAFFRLAWVLFASGVLGIFLWSRFWGGAAIGVCIFYTFKHSSSSFSSGFIKHMTSRRSFLLEHFDSRRPSHVSSPGRDSLLGVCRRNYVKDGDGGKLVFFCSFLEREGWR